MTDKKNAPIIESKNLFLISKVYQKQLVDSNRFVCYTADKKPYNAKTKKLANITDESEYQSYDYAYNVFSNNPVFKGIGFVLGSNNEVTYCGLDIDDCINENGIISNEAIEIINLLDTYTEISKSGKGIHCIFIAKKQGNICKNSNLDFCKCLELYDRGRYFALTGNIIKNKDIENRQEQCNIIYEKYFKCKEIQPAEDDSVHIQQINKQTKNKSYGEDYLKYILDNDKKFKNLWNRTITITDESSTDQAFISKLAYWIDCKNDIIKSWFYKSPYYMGKDKKHKQKALRPDYIDRTIAKAISYCGKGRKAND